ncbi:MAG: PQQ-dependent sugar dehydrogenase, partial [Actinomycetota bacterium]|nr:PQQ-dependent sugar dehydrogenase [Actinomycetota bacterium]
MTRSRVPPALAGLLTVLAVAGAAACTGDDTASSSPSPPDNTAITAPTQSPSPSTTSPAPTLSASPSRPEGPPTPRVAGVVARDLAVPWGIDFLPDGSALVTERDRATIRRILPSGRVRRVGTVTGVVPTSEGGLLGLAVSPTFAQDRWVYVYFTTSSDNRVVRMRYDGSGLGPQRPILTGIPAGFIHDGGRLEFGPDGTLYVSTGETGDGDLAQDRGSTGGKILRINPDGSIPSDNPDPGSPLWTLGHRNVQGLAFDARDRLWATEFGSDIWDELNRIQRGLNYGWPAVEGDADSEQYADPLVQWRPDNASPSGLAFAAQSLWAASLNGERLWQIPVRRGGGVRAPRAHFVGDYGRLRSVVVAPDGSLWV